MPGSSEAITGQYQPTPVPEQDYTRSITGVGKYSNALIYGGLATLLAAVSVAAVASGVIISQNAKSATATTNSSTTTTSSNSTSSTSLSSSTSSTIASSGSTSSTVASGFTVSGSVGSGTSNYYGAEDVSVSCSTTSLTNVTVQIIVQKTVNATYNSGTFSTFWSGTVSQSYVDNGAQIIYTWTIVSGQTITCSGGPYTCEAQFHLSGTSQTTSADTYSVRATTNTGVTSILSGHF